VNAFAVRCPLLAVDLDRLFQLTRGLQSRPEDTPEKLLWLGGLTAGMVLLLWAASRWANRSERRRSYTHPGRLFYELCRAHGLDASSRRLLRRLASYARLAQPAQVFVEPQRFDAAVLPPSLAAEQPRLEQLRARLFAAGDVASHAAERARGH
jgi:hypothetical protein